LIVRRINSLWPLFGIAESVAGRGGAGRGDDILLKMGTAEMDLGDAGADGVAHHDYDDGQLQKISAGIHDWLFVGTKALAAQIAAGKFPRRAYGDATDNI